MMLDGALCIFNDGNPCEHNTGFVSVCQFTDSNNLALMDLVEEKHFMIALSGLTTQDYKDIAEARQILENGDFLGTDESETFLANILNATA